MPKRKHEFNIDDLIPNTLLQNNKTLLRDFKLDFEGLDEQLTHDFIRIVKDLGATVSEDADYILTEYEYFLKGNNRNRSDLFSIEYLKDALENEELPDIELYRFSCDSVIENANNEEKPNSDEIMNENFSDTSEKRIEKSAMQDSPLENRHCSTNPNTSNKETIKLPNESSESEQESNIDDTGENSVTEKKQNKSEEFALKHPNKRKFENKNNISSHTNTNDNNHENFRQEINKKDHSYSTKIAESPSVIIKTVKRMKIEPNSLLDIEMSDDEFDIDDSTRCSTESFRKINIETISSSEEEINDRHKEKTNKTRNVKEETFVKRSPAKPNHSKATTSKWIDAKSNICKVVKTKDTEIDDSQIKVEDEDDNIFLYRKEWWNDHPIPWEITCKRRNCTLEPGLHEKHPNFSRLLSMQEKKVLLKYLISRNLISKSRGKTVYEQMISEGYLAHRTWETLRNCFRRTIFHNLKDFKLPEDILHRLLEDETKN